MSAAAWLVGAIHRAYLEAQRDARADATRNDEDASISNGQPGEPDA